MIKTRCSKCVDGSMHSVSMLTIPAKKINRRHTGMHSKNAASIMIECNCRKECHWTIEADVDSPPSSLWFRFRLLKLQCSALGSYLSIGLLVGVEKLFGCSRAGRFTQLDGFVATLRPDISNIKTLFLPQGLFFTFPPTCHCIQISSSLFSLLWFMAQFLPSRKPMPSFTLVLTSGCHSLPPTTMQFDLYPAPKILPTVPDYLMVSTYDSLLCIYLFFDLHHFIVEYHRFT